VSEIRQDPTTEEWVIVARERVERPNDFTRQEATRASSWEERLSFFESQTVARLRELAETADTWAVPWYARMGYLDGQFPDLAEGWYKSY